MSRQRSSGKKGDPIQLPGFGQPSQQQQQQQQPNPMANAMGFAMGSTPQQAPQGGMPPASGAPMGRMSAAQLKRQMATTQRQQPGVEQQQQQQPSLHQMTMNPSNSKTPMNAIGSMHISQGKVGEDGRAAPQQQGKKGTTAIASMTVSQGKLGEDGRTAKSNTSKYDKSTKGNADNDDDNATPNKKGVEGRNVKNLSTLPLFTHPLTLPIRFDKFLKIDKNTTIGGQILSYPIIGLSQYDASKMGLMMNDLVVLSLVQNTTNFSSPSAHNATNFSSSSAPQSSINPNSLSFTSPTKTPQKEQFKHQHPSLLTTPMVNDGSNNLLSTPRGKNSKILPTPLIQTPSSNRSNNPLISSPNGIHHHLAICRVQTFGTIERGQSRLDIQFKSMLPWYSLYQSYIISSLFPDLDIDSYGDIDFENNQVIQGALSSGAKKDDFEKNFLTQFPLYITAIKDPINYITNTNQSLISQLQNTGSDGNKMYPTPQIETLDFIYFSKENITLTPHQELTYNITQQKASLNQRQNNQNDGDSNEENIISKRLSRSLDQALSASLTSPRSSSVYILPNSPICTSLCGVYRPYYPYHFITQSGERYNQDGTVVGTRTDLNEVNFMNNNSQKIIIYATTPQTAVSITLGKRPEIDTYGSSSTFMFDDHTLATGGSDENNEKLSKNQQNQNQQNQQKHSTSTHVPPPQTTIPIAGLDQEMKILTETLELPLKNPTLFSSFGLKPPKGVLLHGPPGCGKTLLAQWFSTTTEAQFIPLTATNIIARGGASYLFQLFSSLSTTQRGGKGASSRIQLGFDKINNLGQLSADDNTNNTNNTTPLRQTQSQLILPDGKIPVIIFIDEIDGLCSDNTIVCALLSLLDGGHETFSNICILGATNRPNTLPAALRRPGRFDVELNITPPGIQAREEILKVKLQKNGILHRLSPENITSIAEHANGFVGADIDLLISEAISHNVLNGYRDQLESENSANQNNNNTNNTNSSNSSNSSNNNTLSTHDLTLPDFRYALQVVRPSGLRDYSQISVTDSNVGGHEEVKQRLEEAFEWPLRHANLVETLGARKSSGILLFGPPGCAKTLLAKSICARSRRTFLSVKGPELFSKYVGDSEKAVRAIFNRARACAPCILFLDEVDSFGSARGSSGGGDATDRVVSQLLVEMDGISDRGDVCILAATNRPDMIDPALLRAGRLDRSLYVGPPDAHETKEILIINLGKISGAGDILKGRYDDENDENDENDQNDQNDENDQNQKSTSHHSSQSTHCDPAIFKKLDEIAELCYQKRHTGAELAAICRDASVRALTRFIMNQEVKMKELEIEMNTMTPESFLSLIDNVTPDEDNIQKNNQKINNSDNVCVMLSDLIDAVDAAVPRITPNMIQFYVDYQQKHGLTNL